MEILAHPKIIGFSGSPVRNSNTDRLVKHVLENSGETYEFIKLSKLHIGPCHACKGCTKDNICKVKDDFQLIADKIKQADAIVLGSYMPYSVIDAFSKALLERFFSMRHQNSLLKNKLIVSIVTATYEDIRNDAHRAIVRESISEKMRYLGKLNIEGSNPCITCGSGNNCENSIKNRMGSDTDLYVENIVAVENQLVWNEGALLGQKLGNIMKGKEQFEQHSMTIAMQEELKQRYLKKKEQMS